jgi:hypothetical protein
MLVFELPNDDVPPARLAPPKYKSKLKVPDAGVFKVVWELFFLNKKELEPVLETVKSPIVPDPVIPDVKSELAEPDMLLLL